MTALVHSPRRRRLLVVGASPMRAAAFATWHRMGLDVVLVDGHSTGRYEDLATEFWPLDPRDGSADIEQIVKIGDGCDGVTTVSDDSQHTAALVAERLGLPGVGVAAAAAARSKSTQRELCGRHGMRVPAWRKVTSADDLSVFYEDGARPAVIKPVDAAGGAGALRVENLAEAAEHWPIVRSLSPSRTAVIEDFLDGREVCVDAVVSEGSVHFVSVVDCQHMATVGFLCTAATYTTAQPDGAAATAMIAQIVRALDVGEGIVHAEFKISDGEWTIVEIGLRPGGALVPELTVKVTGIDLYEVLARLALGDRPVLPEPGPPQAPYAESRYLVAEGQVRRFVAPSKILVNLPDVRVVNQQAFVGQRMRIPLSEAGRAGYAYGWGTDRRRLDQQLRAAIELLGTQMGLVVRGNDPFELDDV